MSYPGYFNFLGYSFGFHLDLMVARTRSFQLFEKLIDEKLMSLTFTEALVDKSTVLHYSLRDHVGCP